MRPAVVHRALSVSRSSSVVFRSSRVVGPCSKVVPNASTYRCMSVSSSNPNEVEKEEGKKENVEKESEKRESENEKEEEGEKEKKEEEKEEKVIDIPTLILYGLLGATSIGAVNFLLDFPEPLKEAVEEAKKSERLKSLIGSWERKIWWSGDVGTAKAVAQISLSGSHGTAELHGKVVREGERERGGGWAGAESQSE